MRQEHEYILIHDISDSLAVEQTVKRVPLHLTIVHWFTFSEGSNEESMMSSVQQFTQKLAQFNYKGVKREMFGLDFDIPVTTIEKSNQITQLHVGLIEAAGLNVRSQFVGIDGYHPHISDTDDDHFEVGQEQTLRSIKLVRRTDSSSDHTVIATFTLGEAETT